MSVKKFIYGIGNVTYLGMTIGYIEKNSWDWGGSKSESVDIEAEQVPDAAVLTLITKNGTISPTFNMVQLDYENLKATLGGSLIGTKGAYTGWESPTGLVELRGEIKIDFVSGQTMTIPNAMLMANLGGKLTLTEVSKIECQLKINKPDTGSAYKIEDTPTA